MVIMHDDINSESTMTFAQALRDKYINQEEFDNKFILPKDKKISTDITLVGFGSITCVQKQLNRLTSIDLSHKSIESAGDISELKGSLNRVQILNLAENALSWQEIVYIVSCLPNLRDLIITKNRLIADEFVCSSTIGRLSFLTLGRVDLDWTTIVKILSRIWTWVEQLDLWESCLTAEKMNLEGLNEVACAFIKRIRVLKLSHNRFVNLDWICSIGPIENLVELDLSKCQLQSIKMNAVTVKQLQNLEFLNISYNNLESWESISSLHWLNNLRSLICHENPIFISEKFAKSLTIGRLGKLRYLNREEITRNMRRDSELLYLRRTFPEYQSFFKGESEDFKSLHPRFEEVAQIYGLPEDLTKTQVVDKYVNVELCLGEKKITKKLPCDMRIANVQMLCKRLFKLRPSSPIQITCCGVNSSGIAIDYVLDKDGQTLHFFSVKNGQKLNIKELNQ